MEAKLINEDPERTFAPVFDRGDEVMSLLERFAAEQGLSASRLTAIGAFERATLGYFDLGAPRLHLHAVLGRRDGSTLGGHLLEAHVRPTLEVLLVDSPGYLRRVRDPVSGLALIRIGDGDPPGKR